jgi:hypothetical protein
MGAEPAATRCGEMVEQVGHRVVRTMRGDQVKDDNALVKHGYATQSEITSFKANAQDPRHSGPDAVHGVASGPLKGKKMTEGEGFEFVARLLNTYLDR